MKRASMGWEWNQWSWILVVLYLGYLLDIQLEMTSVEFKREFWDMDKNVGVISVTVISQVLKGV